MKSPLAGWPARVLLVLGCLASLQTVRAETLRIGSPYQPDRARRVPAGAVAA
jgi:hypothetical protein